MNPFTQTPSESAGAWGEKCLIDAIRKWLGPASPPPPAGIGDDCAVLSPTAGCQVLVTTDPVLWQRHFDEGVSPEQAAAKLFKRNLSDIAGMGGRGRIAVVSLLLPASTSVEWLERFYRGLREQSERYGVPLAGGDISQTGGLLAACMTVIGETTGPRALTRAGAEPGDHLFVTGRLGGSLLGHHCTFEPRLIEGAWLAGREEVVAGMDISDGLAKDLPALLPAGTVARLRPEAIPLTEAAAIMAARTGRSALYHALCDGEDYELLLAVKAVGAERLVADWQRRFRVPLTAIGTVDKGTETETRSPLQGLPGELQDQVHGYEHFS